MRNISSIKNIDSMPTDTDAFTLQGESDDLGDDLIDLCIEEIEYLLGLVGAKPVDRVIIRLSLRGMTDNEISDSLHNLSGREWKKDTVKKRRQRCIYRMLKKAGVGLGWITVLKAQHLL